MSLQAHKVFFRDSVQSAFRRGGKEALAKARRRFLDRRFTYHSSGQEMVDIYKSAEPGSARRHNYATAIRSLFRDEILKVAGMPETYTLI